MIAEVKRLRSELEASRHRVAELEEQFSLLKEIASNSVAALADLPDRQFAKFRIAALEAALRAAIKSHDKIPPNIPLPSWVESARSTLEGKHPNAESLAAIQELEDGGGEMFSSVEALMKDLESDD
jgi:hypothetical protein